MNFDKSIIALPPLDEIIFLHGEAMGGKENWRKLKSYRRVSHRPDGQQVTITCFMPNRISILFSDGQSNVTKFFDGQHGYLLKDGLYEPMRPGEKIEMEEEARYYSELIFYREEGYNLKLLGEEPVDYIDCFKLSLKKSSRDEQIYWINKSTYLIEQTGEYSEDSAHQGIYYKTRLTNYRSIDGLMFPSREILIANDDRRRDSGPIRTEIDLSQEEDRFHYLPDNTENLIRYWKDRFSGENPRSMSFSQKTVRFSEGEPDTAIWREFICYPDQFRIDFTDTSGNINLYRNDSIYVFRDRQLVFQGKEIQAFLLIEGGIYFLPVEQVLRGLEETGIDTRLFAISSFDGHRIMILGAGEGDLSRPQMWIDPDRRVIIRQLLKTNEGSLLDVRSRNFEYLQGCWVTSSLDFYEGDRRVQSEEYFDIRINPPVDTSIFSTSRCLETYWYSRNESDSFR